MINFNYLMIILKNVFQKNIINLKTTFNSKHLPKFYFSISNKSTINDKYKNQGTVIYQYKNSVKYFL
jgi:hypothetical protein